MREKSPKAGLDKEDVLTSTGSFMERGSTFSDIVLVYCFDFVLHKAFVSFC